jgi:hypothetical protein
MPLAGDAPRSRALAHSQWAGRYSRLTNDEHMRVTSHLDRAEHYMRMSRFGMNPEPASDGRSLIACTGPT